MENQLALFNFSPLPKFRVAVRTTKGEAQEYAVEALNHEQARQVV